MGFRWTPGEGPDESSLIALSENVKRPSSPMGEAWFMSKERRVFTELEGDIDCLSVEHFQEVLQAIVGCSAFGRREEWVVWFEYLLPRLVPRCNERMVSWLLEEVCTAFLVVDLGREDGSETEVYRANVLNTLGLALMSPDRWDKGNVVLGKILHPSNRNPARIWGWFDVSGDLAASLVLCLRLIQKKDIAGWVESIFAIRCPYWRAQILTWYVGAKPLLTGKVAFPSDFVSVSPRIEWSWSHAISGNQGGRVVTSSLFPPGNLDQFKTSVETQLKLINLEEWQKGILEVEALQNEVGALIRGFETR